jgi:predicted house-cleaning noncanonical NTP pyrophosphatase (MazG superfamily)
MTLNWDNRVAFVVRFLYDTDNNGYLDRSDFENLALRNTLLELSGEYTKEKHDTNKAIMINLWNEIATLADFNKDGQVTVDEFKKAVQDVCVGKKFADLPISFRASIQAKFRSIDNNGDDLIQPGEYRIEIINRCGNATIQEIDQAWTNLLNDEDKKRGGINLVRYQDLWAEFIGDKSATCHGANLFGPLPPVQ